MGKKQQLPVEIFCDWFLPEVFDSRKGRARLLGTLYFWVLYNVEPTDPAFRERFFELTHLEVAKIQGECNFPDQVLSYEEQVERVRQGVDNVKLAAVESFTRLTTEIFIRCVMRIRHRRPPANR